MRGKSSTATLLHLHKNPHILPGGRSSTATLFAFSNSCRRSSSRPSQLRWCAGGWAISPIQPITGNAFTGVIGSIWPEVPGVTIAIIINFAIGVGQARAARRRVRELHRKWGIRIKAKAMIAEDLVGTLRLRRCNCWPRPWRAHALVAVTIIRIEPAVQHSARVAHARGVTNRISAFFVCRHAHARHPTKGAVVVAVALAMRKIRAPVVVIKRFVWKVFNRWRRAILGFT